MSSSLFRYSHISSIVYCAMKYKLYHERMQVKVIRIGGEHETDQSDWQSRRSEFWEHLDHLLSEETFLNEAKKKVCPGGFLQQRDSNCFLDVWLNVVASKRKGNQAFHLGQEFDQLLTKINLRFPANIIGQGTVAMQHEPFQFGDDFSKVIKQHNDVGFDPFECMAAFNPVKMNKRW